MGFLRTLLVTAILAAAVLFLGGLALGSSWDVSRSLVIAAPSPAIHAQVADLRAWEAWSPFDKGDPEIRFHYDGAASGVGARRTWVSQEMGDGWMEITAADPATGVWYDIGIEGMDPFKGVLQYEPAEGGTRVTWTSRGDVGGRVLYRWMVLFMDGMLGSELDKGLADLAQVVQQPS